MLVNYWIDFHDLKAGHASVISDDLHSQMGFSVAGAAADRRAYAGSIFGIDPVHVERYVVTGRAASGDPQGFFHHGTHAALVDIAHGIDLDACGADVGFLARVNIAYAHQHTVIGL